MTVAEIIAEKLKKAFSPSTLVVEDQSHQHKGHAGHREGVETHFHVTIVSDAFEGQPRVARHRMVTNALKDEIGNPIHALALKIQTSAEVAKDD